MAQVHYLGRTRSVTPEPLQNALAVLVEQAGRDLYVINQRWARRADTIRTFEAENELTSDKWVLRYQGVLAPRDSISVAYGGDGSRDYYGFPEPPADSGIEAAPGCPMTDCGKPVAEMGPNNVALHQLANGRPFREGDTPGFTWGWLIAALQTAINPEHWAGQIERREAAARTALIEHLNNRPNSRLDDLREQCQALETNLISYQANLQRTRRELNNLRPLVEAAIATSDTVAWEDKLNALLNHPRVTEYELGPGLKITLTTDHIWLRDPRDPEERAYPEAEYLYLGPFKMIFNLETGFTEVHNLTTKRNRRSHPHVANVTPCWGGLETQISDLFQRGELEAVYAYHLNFLETVNLDDCWGCYLSYWAENPPAPPEGVTPPGFTVAEAVAA